MLRWVTTSDSRFRPLVTSDGAASPHAPAGPFELNRAAFLVAPPRLLRAQLLLDVALFPDALSVVGLLVQIASLLSILALFANLLSHLSPSPARLGALGPFLPLGPLSSQAFDTAVPNLHVLAILWLIWIICVGAEIAMEGREFVRLILGHPRSQLVPRDPLLRGDRVDIVSRLGDVAAHVFPHLLLLCHLYPQLPLPLCSVLVRVTLADPVHPLALSEDAGQRGTLNEELGLHRLVQIGQVLPGPNL